MCLKCIILVTNFQKSPSAGGSPPPASRKRIIAITSLENVAKITITKFFYFTPPPQSKFLATPVHCTMYTVVYTTVRVRILRRRLRYSCWGAATSLDLKWFYFLTCIIHWKCSLLLKMQLILMVIILMKKSRYETSYNCHISIVVYDKLVTIK